MANDPFDPNTLFFDPNALNGGSPMAFGTPAPRFPSAPAPAAQPNIPQGAAPAAAQAMPMPAPAAPNPIGGSIGDRLGNYINNNPMMLMALGGGIARGGIGAGLQAAVPVAQQEQQLRLQQQGQLAAYNAIRQAGGSHEQAVAGALNPDTYKTLRELALKEDEGKVVPFGSQMVGRTGNVLFGGNASDALIDPETVKFMAQQYRAGDTTVMQNLRGGALGQQNIANLRKEITRQNTEAGVGGAGQAMTNAEFFGVKSGQRTLGTKSANIEMAATEFKQVLPVVQAASDAVNRTNYPDLNRIIQMGQEKTGDPNIVKFGGGVNTLVNLYARAISPSGVGTVSDKDHAREILQKAWSTGQFNAAVGMMQQEIDAALASPEKVRDAMRTRFLGGAAPQVAPSAPGGSTTLPAGIPPPPPGFQIVR